MNIARNRLIEIGESVLENLELKMVEISAEIESWDWKKDAVAILDEMDQALGDGNKNKAYELAYQLYQLLRGEDARELNNELRETTKLYKGVKNFLAAIRISSNPSLSYSPGTQSGQSYWISQIVGYDLTKSK